MNNPLIIGDNTRIESVFNKKIPLGVDEAGRSPHLVILAKILNSYKNLIFSSFISKKQGFNY